MGEHSYGPWEIKEVIEYRGFTIEYYERNYSFTTHDGMFKSTSFGDEPKCVIKELDLEIKYLPSVARDEIDSYLIANKDENKKHVTIPDDPYFDIDDYDTDDDVW